MTLYWRTTTDRKENQSDDICIFFSLVAMGSSTTTPWQACIKMDTVVYHLSFQCTAAKICPLTVPRLLHTLIPSQKLLKSTRISLSYHELSKQQTQQLTPGCENKVLTLGQTTM